MSQLNIEEFEGYDLYEITEFLSLQDDDKFEINIPKESVVFFSDHNGLAWEYAIAAYIGQKLNEISTEFDYSEPSMHAQGYFSFTIKTNKVDELAEFLLEVSSAFGNSEIVEPINFSCEVGDFIQNNDRYELACPDFVETYNEYYTPEKDDDE